MDRGQEKMLHAAPLSTIETLSGRKNKPITAQRCSQSDPKLLLSIVVVLGQKNPLQHRIFIKKRNLN